MVRLTCALTLIAGLLCAGYASGSSEMGRPTFRIFLKATNGVVPDITRGPDGRMWFTEQFADQIGAITDSGIVTHYRTGGKAQAPTEIVVGPDNKLWYTLYGSAGEIGRMTTRGAHTEFNTGAVVNSLVGIGVGAGKSLWVGGAFSQLWQVATDGKILSHLMPPALTASRIPSGFVAGSDGRTWVNLGIFIAAIDATGAVTEYKDGYSPSPNIRNLVLGPDGNIWFTDSQNLQETGLIGRITPAGVVTKFTRGLKRGSAPLGLTVGPDGKLWFTENAGGAFVGSITTAGAITLYRIPIPSSYNASAIARGRGRTLWVASNALAGLVRMTVP